MKILNFTMSKPLAVIPMGNRLYKLADDCDIEVYTDEGVFIFHAKKYAVTNYRSGGPLVDSFIDQIGDEAVAPWWVIHDLCYTPCAALGMEHPLSRKMADELLRAGLIYAGMSKWKAQVVYTAVRWFGESAYEEDDALTSSNSKLFTFEWIATA